MSDSMDFVPILLEAAKESPVGMLIADAGGVIQYVNPPYEALSGYGADELLGRDVGVLACEQPDADVQGAIDAALAAGQTWKGELCARRKDGAVYWQDATISPVRDAAGNLTHTVRISIDITDHVRQREAFVEARKAAEEANEAKSRFLANMSHEIRTPMNVVLGLSTMLLKHRAENLTDYQRQRLAMIGESGQRLMALLNDILDLSKVESGKIEAGSEAVSLSALMIQIEGLAENFIRARSIAFQITKAEDVPDRIVTDPQLLEQVLMNLLSNAYKFTDAGHIHVRIYRRGAELFFDVEDTGIGIAPEHQDMIFDQFTQADSSTTRRYKGTGLGLAISKKLVTLMGGRISVRSALGQGTTMTFCVPLRQASDAGPAVVKEASGDSSKATRRRKPVVLAAEDDEYGRVYLEMAMEDDYDVHFACDGADAVDRYFELTPDIVLMDIMMPRMDGFDAYAEICRRSETPPVPIIALSAKAMKTEQAEILSHGFTDYVSKPIDDAVLIAVIEKHLKASSG